MWRPKGPACVRSRSDFAAARSPAARLSVARETPSFFDAEVLFDAEVMGPLELVRRRPQFERPHEKSLQQNEEEKQQTAAYHDPRAIQRAVEIDEGGDESQDHAAEQRARDIADAARQQRA